MTTKTTSNDGAESLYGELELAYRDLPRHDRVWILRVSPGLFGLIAVTRLWGRRGVWLRRYPQAFRPPEAKRLVRSVLERRRRHGYHLVAARGLLGELWRESQGRSRSQSRP